MKVQIDQWYVGGMRIEDFFHLSETVRFIVLYRQDLLQQYISHRSALTTGVWKSWSRPQQGDSKLIHVDETEFFRFQWLRRLVYHRFYEETKDYGIHPVSYEQLTGSNQLVSLLSRLSGETIAVARTPLKRQQNQRLEQIIADYPSLAKRISDYRYITIPFEEPTSNRGTNSTTCPLALRMGSEL